MYEYENDRYWEYLNEHEFRGFINMIEMVSDWVHMPWFWVGMFFLGVSVFLGLSALDNRDWKNYLKKDRDLDDGV